MHNFYTFSDEGDSLMVSIEKRNSKVLMTFGEFEIWVDADSAMELADSLIDVAYEINEEEEDEDDE